MLRKRSWSNFGQNLSVLSCLVGISVPLAVFLLVKLLPGHGSCDDSSEKLWYLCAESRGFLLITIAAVLSSACLFGSLGAIFSFLLRRGTPVFPRTALVASCFIGAMAALVLSLLFAGGFIAGNLFPNYGYGYSEIGWFGLIYRTAEFSKLLVWAFIVGFSERVLPGVLQTLTGKLVVKETPGGASNSVVLERDEQQTPPGDLTPKAG